MLSPHVKVIQSGDTIEVWTYEKHSTASKRIHIRKKKKAKTVMRMPSRYALRTRQKSFTRLVRANLDSMGAPVLCTLTMRDIVPLKRAYRLYTLFQQRLRRLVPGVVHIAVPEWQKRGAVHFHVLLWGLPPEYAKHERKNRIVARMWGEGYVDLFQSDGKPALVGYLSKYLSKTMGDYRLRDSRSYSASRNCKRPNVITSPAILAYSKDVWGIDISGDKNIEFQKQYGTLWLGRCDYKVFKIKREND